MKIEKTFDRNSNAWIGDGSYNRMFVYRQLDYAFTLLKSRGHLFINEVYDMLAMPRTKSGQIMGWVYDELNDRDFVTITSKDNNVDVKIEFQNVIENVIDYLQD